MKRYSKGVNAFATPPPHYRDFSSRYRLLAEQGRTDEIARTIRTERSAMTSDEDGFDWEDYMRWAPKLYNSSVQICRSVWSPDYWMLEDVDFTRRAHVYALRNVWLNVVRDKQLDQYIPVRWTTEALSQYDVETFPAYLVGRAERKSIPLYYFALRTVPGNERYHERLVLYAKRSWLMTFNVGLSLLNYYQMAIDGKFQEVYGFT